MRSKSLRDQLIVGFASAVVLSGALASTHPIYMAKTAIMQRFFSHAAPDTTTAQAPWLTLPTALAIRSPQFLADRQAFADDLLRTGKVHRERAWQLADIAV